MRWLTNFYDFRFKMNSIQQELEYTLLKPDCHSWCILKMQFGREEERYAIKLCFKLGKNAMRWKLDLLLWPRDQETEFLVEACWLSQTQEGQTEQIHPQTFDDPFFWQHWHDLHALGSHWTDSQQGILCWSFKGVQEEIPWEEASTLQIGSVAPVHNSILVTDYLMGIKRVPHRPYSSDLAPCDFWLFPKLTGCRYETIEEMKEAVTKVIETLTQEDFHGAFQKLLERYNKCIAAGGRLLRRGLESINKSAPYEKSLETFLNDPRIYIYIYIYIY